MTTDSGATEYSAIYDPDQDFDSIYTRATATRLARWLQPGDRVLELGCATSLMTSLLPRGLVIDCVEKSERYLAIARRRALPDVQYHHGTLEEFSTPQRFDHVLMTNVLHELHDPAPVLRKAATWLKAGGRLHVTTPNPESIHRKVALRAGLLPDLTALSDRGQQFLTVRLYYNREVVELVERHAGLRSVHRDGILFKPLANAQMAALAPNILEAFDALAHEFPDHGAMTYFVFENARPA